MLAWLGRASSFRTNAIAVELAWPVSQFGVGGSRDAIIYARLECSNREKSAQASVHGHASLSPR